ncbi:acyl-CoA dehydrogenase family protein [uncultured Phenylobacterium sp.]|uniref:acyl-CoA dehydrogenase family protein n=1 Tax=uncultured Phenylobacterium sp. TaxID=349273 RepID=UPI0025D2B422|nr:acyl-CoA dehydrogenase family protein [uncultured Phenylobacterium sp.]
MDFSFTEEQSMLRDTVAAYLADHYDFDKRRAAVAKEPGWRPAVWKAFAEELGILGAPFSEELGGLGGGPIDNMVVMEEFGKALVVEPYLGTVVIGGGFLKHSGHAGAADLIGGIIEGKNIFAFASAEPQSRYNLAAVATTAKKDGAGWVLNGHKAVVVGAAFATHLIVTARTSGGERDAQGISVFLVEKGARGVTTRDYPTVDGNRASEVYFENVSVGADALIGPADHGLPLVEKVVDEAIAATCAEACGVLRKLHEGTVEYTKQRKQFGQPISSFQVLQHRMVDMFINVEQAVSMTYMANIKVTDDAERAKAASAAKVQIGKACRFVGQNAIQLHGGMGMTDEMAIGHYFKRATMIESAFGSVDHHLARYEFLSLGHAA